MIRFSVPRGGIERDMLRLTAIQQRGIWRVKLAWQNRTPRYFGKFRSQADADKWIEDHRWLNPIQADDKTIPARHAEGD